MDPEVLLLRYGEIFLKGKNRAHFERKLVANITKITGLANIRKFQSRLVANYSPGHAALKAVFGLVSYSPSFFVENNLNKIKKKALEILQARLLQTSNRTFKVETKRSDKSFPLTSLELNGAVGEYIEANSTLRFSFEKPDHLLKIEVSQEGTFLFFDTISCFGGLPTGVEGKVAVLVENEASILAGLLFMKRGCSIFLIAFGNADNRFGESDISLLQKYSPTSLHLNIVKDLSELEDDVLVTGETYSTVKRYETGLVLRPLIAYTEEKIEKALGEFRQIN